MGDWAFTSSRPSFLGVEGFASPFALNCEPLRAGVGRELPYQSLLLLLRLPSDIEADEPVQWTRGIGTPVLAK